MEKMVFKFTAEKIDEIEKAKGVPIENCVGDTTVGGLSLIIRKCAVNDGGGVGMTQQRALSAIDSYLAQEGADKFDLVIDIMEGLVAGGFLQEGLDTEMMRNKKKEETAKATAQLREM